MDFSLDAGVEAILFFVLGLVFGSFSSVLLSRIPQRESIGGRSHCPFCRRTLTAPELIPVVSFLLQRGKCRGCSASIPLSYPFLELVSGGMFLAASLWRIDAPLIETIGLALSLWGLFLIAILDWHTKLIPDPLTITVAAGALLLHMSGGMGAAAIGAFVGLLFFGAQWIVSGGKWVGSGDVLLAGAIGLFLGSWQLLLVSLFVAYVTGAFVAVVFLIRHGAAARKMQIPFGPFLVLGAFIAFFAGERILDYIVI